ncbi:MAG: hypothetical protein HQL52_14820 [Magnetococcales bacterium]|nr:hypothetical protein [Magnetococcales bacterium]
MAEINVVTDLGADNTGNTDASGVIQSSINNDKDGENHNKGINTYIFPPGTYRFDNYLTPKPGQKFKGSDPTDKPTIKTDGVPYAFFLPSNEYSGEYSGCEFRSLKFREVDRTSSAPSVAIQIEDRDNVLIEDCKAIGYTQYGFVIQAVTRSIVNPRMIGNTVKKHAESGSDIAIGLLVDSPIDPVTYDSNGGVVAGNRVFLSEETTADGVCCKIENFRNITVQDNTFHRGNIQTGSNSAALTLIGLRNSTVKNNTITSLVDTPRLAAVTITSSQDAGGSRYTLDVLFLNNVLNGNTTPGLETGALLLNGDLRNVRIIDNEINAQLEYNYTDGSAPTMASNIALLTISANEIGTYFKCTSNKIDNMTLSGNTIEQHLKMIPDASAPSVSITNVNIDNSNTINLSSGEPIHLEAPNTSFDDNIVTVDAAGYQTNHLVRIAADYVSVTNNNFIGSGTNQNIQCLVSLESGITGWSVNGNQKSGSISGVDDLCSS